MSGVPLDGLHQVRDQVVPPLELDVDLPPGLLDQVPQPHQAVVGEPIRRVRKESLRLYFRVDGLGELLAKGQAKNEGAQVIDTRHRSKVLQETSLSAESYLLAALALIASGSFLSLAPDTGAEVSGHSPKLRPAAPG